MAACLKVANAGCAAHKAGDNEVDYCIGEHRNDQTYDRIKNSVFGGGDIGSVAARNHVAQAADDNHNDADSADDK